jgi:hypothetical protein
MKNIRRGEPGHWTQQTRRDRDWIEIQKRKCGPFFYTMQHRLRLWPKKVLLEPLGQYCQQRNLPAIPRLCRRSKDALVCYFCFHCRDFPMGFPPLIIPPAPAPAPLPMSFFGFIPTVPRPVRPPSGILSDLQPPQFEMPPFDLEDHVNGWNEEDLESDSHYWPFI